MILSRRSVMLGAAAAPLIGMRAEAAPDVIRFGLSAYPPNLQPWVSTGQAAVTVKLLLYRGLLSFAPDGSVRAELAEHWERDGDTGWVFHLREALFHSGAPVTAQDVAWSIQQIGGTQSSSAFLHGQFQSIKSVETPDPRTVRIITQEPTSVLPLWMANPYSAIVEQKSVANGGTPVGAGPYTLASLERGVSINLAAWGKFYKPGLPKTKNVRMIAYADENLRMSALKAGDVDIIEYVPWQSMHDVETDPRLRLDGSVGPFMNLLFNGTTGPFKDVRVRQAVAYAIRREEIVQAAFFGRGATLGGMPIAPGTPFYDAKLADTWHHDPDHAKALLAEAGLAKGFNTTLLATAQYIMHKTTAEVVQQHLAGIGVQAKLDLPEWGQRVTLGNRGQYEFAVFGTTTDNNDPDGMQTVLDGQLPMSYGRSANMPTPEIDQLFIAGRREFDDAKRHAIYTQLQQIALRDAPMVTLCWRSQAYAMTKNLQGFTSLPGALSYNSGATLETTYLA
jgi:ABC-type transport system substrate-binding protein